MLMQDERPHAQGRRIARAGVDTPLLVPSFSSCGFPWVGEIYGEMMDKLYGVCLVSAFDLASGSIPTYASPGSNVQVVDSGTYEARKLAAGWGGRDISAGKALWSRERYLEIVACLDGDSNAILVNYDGYDPLNEQVQRAADDFCHAPNAARDFLLKPEAPARLLNIARLAQHADGLDQFDIVGVTAREAGNSLSQRCRTLVMLRDVLDDANLDVPVHVFGAITPKEVMAYFFCGADVFDGLAWLRSAFRDQGPIAIETTAFEGMNPTLSDFELHTAAWTANLSVLYRLQVSLQRYCSTGDFDELMRDFPEAVRAADVAELAGAVISNKRGVQAV